MKRYCLALLSCLFLFDTSISFSQEMGAGVRLSSVGGLSGKFFLDGQQAIEAQLNGNGYGLDIIGLYEYHMPLSDAQWRWYFGGGAHIGSWNHGTHGSNLVGIDGVIGIEYLFKKVPVGISLDFKPAFDFSNDAEVFTAHNVIGLAGRYYFRRHAVQTNPEAK